MQESIFILIEIVTNELNSIVVYSEREMMPVSVPLPVTLTANVQYRYEIYSFTYVRCTTKSNIRRVICKLNTNILFDRTTSTIGVKYGASC